MPTHVSASSEPAPSTVIVSRENDCEALRVVVLASGEGSNLQALIDAVATGDLPANIVQVCSDRPDCTALKRAGAAGIATWARAPREFASRTAFDESLFEAIAGVQPGLIVCAGYLRLISAFAVVRHAGQMINIHPSLLPAFPGLHTHARALAEGVRTHGASVHFVTATLDAGPLIAQASVPVHADDDPARLGARVLTREHPLLVRVAALFAQRRLHLRDDNVWLDDEPLPQPLQLTADDTLTLRGTSIDA